MATAHLNRIHVIMQDYFSEVSVRTLKGKDKTGFQELDTAYKPLKSPEDYKAYLQNNFQYFWYIHESALMDINAFWHNQSKDIELFNNFMNIDLLNSAPASEKLIYIFVLQFVEMKKSDPEQMKRSLDYLGRVVSKMRLYNDQSSSYTQEKKEAFIQQFICDINRYKEDLATHLSKQDDDQEASDNNKKVHVLLAILDTINKLLGSGNIFYSDLPFLLLKGDLPFHDDKVMGEIFSNNALLLNAGYMSILMSLENSIDFLDKNKLVEKCDKIVSPLLDKVKNFFDESRKRQTSLIHKMSKKSDPNQIEIINFLNDLRDWELAEINAFFDAHAKIIEELEAVDENEEQKKEAFDACEKISNFFFNELCESLDSNVFSHTFSIRQWGLIKSLEQNAVEKKSKKLAPVKRPLLSLSQPTPSTSDEKEDKNTIDSMSLSNGVGQATLQKVETVNPYAQGFLDTIKTELIPSILETVDQEVFPQRTFEKTKLLLEQGLKFAITKKDHYILYEKGNGWTQQQKLASHSLKDLFLPLSTDFNNLKFIQTGDFELKVTFDDVLTYFSESEPDGDLRGYVACALVATEKLLNYSKKQPESFQLKRSAISSSAPLQAPVEIISRVSHATDALEKLHDKFLDKERLFPYFVIRIDGQEKLGTLLHRQNLFMNCLQNALKVSVRLQSAIDEGTDQTPLAYCAELYHSSSFLLENTLHLLIAYNAIKGDAKSHVIYKKIGTQTQKRRFYYNHNLKELGKELEDYFKQENLHPKLFDKETKKIIEDLQSYNSKTHRYLVHDKTDLGSTIREFHEEIQWKDGRAEKLTEFCENKVYPDVARALDTFFKLINALPG
jgi:hypothetical protein